LLGEFPTNWGKGEVVRYALRRGVGSECFSTIFWIYPKAPSQNWIGGSNLTYAVYIPPHHEEVPDLINDLENFWHNEDVQVPHLIRIALSHYQFETIYPFLDGNGRVGRLLITLYLVGFNLLSKSSLYLSDFFEKRRVSYYDALSRVRESHDLIHWVKFFLNAVIETSEKGKATFMEIMALKNRVDEKIVTLNRRAKIGQQLIRFLYSKPVVTANDVVSALEISSPTANDLLQSFSELEILHETTGLRRNRIFEFNEYTELFKRD
jgi:Fic family protein